MLQEGINGHREHGHMSPSPHSCGPPGSLPGGMPPEAGSGSREPGQARARLHSPPQHGRHEGAGPGCHRQRGREPHSRSLETPDPWCCFSGPCPPNHPHASGEHRESSAGRRLRRAPEAPPSSAGGERDPSAQRNATGPQKVVLSKHPEGRGGMLRATAESSGVGRVTFQRGRRFVTNRQTLLMNG